MKSAEKGCIEIDPRECHRFIQAWRDEGCRVIDVRTPKEYASGHIEGAENIDFFSPGFTETIHRLDREKPYVVYCRTGVRGGKTLSQMRDAGFVRVVNIRGGIECWRSEGLPTV